MPRERCVSRAIAGQVQNDRLCEPKTVRIPISCSETGRLASDSKDKRARADRDRTASDRTCNRDVTTDFRGVQNRPRILEARKAKSVRRPDAYVLLNAFDCLEREKGFEPSTPTLARLCSTPELLPHRTSAPSPAAWAGYCPKPRRSASALLQVFHDLGKSRSRRVSERLGPGGGARHDPPRPRPPSARNTGLSLDARAAMAHLDDGSGHGPGSSAE